jgi:hypothetical protein
MMVGQDHALAQAKRCFSFATTRAAAAVLRSTRRGLFLTKRFARPGSPVTVALACDLVIGAGFLAIFLADLAAILDFLAFVLMG